MIGRYFEFENETYLIVEDDGVVIFLSTADDLEFFKHKFKVDQLIIDNQACGEVVAQLEAYFHGKRQSFNFPYRLYGTPFQVTVWQGLLDIPYGQTLSYEGLSDALFETRKTRAVARAVGQNPIMICVPCHRIIGKNGKLTGYRSGLALKTKLLNLEQGAHYGNHR